MELELFQQKTVEAAVMALSVEQGSRRFLVADEVGLGKTVVAREVAKALAQAKTGPFNVVYFCPNLEIASQNLTKFKKLDDEWEAPHDRLSLVGVRPQAKKDGFRIFSFTPDTSLPGWKGGSRTGRDFERQTIASLTHAVAPLFWRRLRALERRRRHTWFQTRGFEPRGYWPDHLPDVPPGLKRPFEAALRSVMNLEGMPLESGLRTWLDEVNDGAEYILRARSALSLASLRMERTKPHLLILDEFHRYADLIRPPAEGKPNTLDAERKRVLRLLTGALFAEGEEAPAVLLLSATPYRLMRADGGALPGSRYDHLVQLVEFLYSGSGEKQASQFRRRIVTHHGSLEIGKDQDREHSLARAREAKVELEAVLRPVIARTERATSIKEDLFDRRRQPAPLSSSDLEIFRHFATTVARKMPDLKGWVLPLWTSVPYPAETLFDYKVGKAFDQGLPRLTSVGTAAERAAHPQLRALVAPSLEGPPPIAMDLLSLPWLPPTRPWWTLGGKWSALGRSDNPPGKALLFSRYVATPKAVSALLSAHVDRASSKQQDGGSKFSAQAYLRFDATAPGPLIAMFMPWSKLSHAPVYTDGGNRSASYARKANRKLFRKWLSQHDSVVITSRKGTPRKAWRLAIDVEFALGGGACWSSALRSIRSLKATNLSPASHSLSLTAEEVDLLSDWLLSSPGSIVGRSLARHQPAALEDPKSHARGFRFCWSKLRLYLGQRYFAGAILRKRVSGKPDKYPDALRSALVDGGFEAVLDEHLAVTGLVGDATPLDNLEHAIIARPGQIRLRRGGTKKFARARVHAAMPFSGAQSRGGGKSEEIRSDGIRRAFNSPFWPHVLATTSIGQEGLDFHVWCDRVIHWDLPRDPVDFEQREGRVDRYGSLSVRRALAEQFGNGIESAAASPFEEIFKRARKAPRTAFGLERWWSPLDHKPRSFTFETPLTMAGVRFNRLRDDLMRYRLALGQPEPGLFGQFVEHFKLSRDEVRELAVNLSPARDRVADILC
ncbi:C-terminal helicase domain-containing protein [Rhizobium leguminosarum]|uniref:C-terminal helicase domain-containing protein n=1 Tax=Rhizobium leguminosarum TaxID=384 RepID=UPI001C9161A0|nr:DEAD/DEAH box helicase family protein [Rhizobium leguminosarum]MBY2950946.1 DEAD/DEAH box helicase family protein [Rhizobium leguminosarum]